MNYWLAKYGYDKANYLAHHGILGQKWDIRRYQNPDGTLTSAGKKRYSSGKNIKNFDEDAYKASKREELQKIRGSRSDAENEAELKAAYRAWEKEDFDPNGKDEQTMLNLFNEIASYSTGSYHDPAVSPEAKAFDKKYEKFQKDRSDDRSAQSAQYLKDRESLRKEYCGIALKDIGFKDTEKNRRYLYGLLWDDANLPLND